MKYKLETIPLWDAFKEETECPFCFLKEKAEKRYLKYYLGNSAMNPETRVELNITGFCPDHFGKLLIERSPQHLGLITHTHLKDWRADLEKRFPSGKNGTSLFSRWSGPKGSETGEYKKTNDSRIQGCLICDRIERTIQRYTFTACFLWKRDEEGFRSILKSSKGFCIPHEGDLLLMASEILKQTEQDDFFVLVKDLQKKNFQRLEEELDWFTQKFKAENNSQPWGNSEDAHYRVIQKLTGKRTDH
ncbi:DUF6062 family protein [Oceanispirochaeta sp.]|jgi:hypothetical protein|uniref:DUF6062 family protein n=1 Tax=Oceanispirochaeta sp. TaxID=2035350 RepID=UPI0026227BA3|nr:DUF6062 family protein [Oceanispirochaeta sp.]MDA3957790.1 DUF6062 family protein [Oceanispirochaeta sp.]